MKCYRTIYETFKLQEFTYKIQYNLFIERFNVPTSRDIDLGKTTSNRVPDNLYYYRLIYIGQ